MTTIESPVRMLPFYCPIPAAIHPRVAEAEQRAVEWIDRIGLCEDERQRRRTIGTNSAELFGRFAPYADDDGLQVAIRWAYWGFLFDDMRCDAGEYSMSPHDYLSSAATVQRALEAPWHPVSDDRFSLALQDIGRDMHAVATPVQVQRFVDAHRAWLFAVACQVANRECGHMPSLEEYTAMRLHSAGGAPTLGLLEIANRAEVPPAEMDSPPVRALCEMAYLIDSWDNDIHSYSKETAEDHAEQNLVNVLIHHQGLRPDEAMRTAVALRDRIMVRFLALRERVTARPCSRALRVHLDCLGQSIRGNTDWALSVPRYTTAAPALPRPGWSDHPSDDNPDPLPIPAIAWWWDDLEQS
ncbi:terpene synthase family protein [Saccharothrix variisporea]|uniref:Terpene synthase n=1 Tax=Saccharothrix variisporea TaxID=543527 RepID=A0A495WZT8_9PSEU|nr:hypothetical protein [Saccharothrix variisporea]RKT67192.1 hypothetical protein DFJ66_0360 [Saccharothrix variisporea]